jgi:hypothetical protein
MLDVHPSHAPIRGWRDFFVQIATIVVGLCIAVGIQQTVELIQHRSQRAELRKALRLEREQNYKTFTANTTAWRWGTAELQNDLLVFQYLQQHPGTPQEKLPGILVWRTSNFDFSSAAWDAAHQSGAIALLPNDEIEANSALYSLLQKVNEIEYDSARSIENAARYNFSDPDPSHLTPAQIATEIDLTEAALTAHYLRGALLLDVVDAAPDFPATISSKELAEARHAQGQSASDQLAPARALTLERLKAAGYGSSQTASAPAAK